MRQRSRRSKKLCRATGRDRARQGKQKRPSRDLVRGRGAHRPEERDRPTMGETRIADRATGRPAHRERLPLRRDLSRRRHRRGAGAALRRYRGDAVPPERSLRRRRQGRSRRSAARPRRLAPLGKTHHPEEHHACGALAKCRVSSQKSTRSRRFFGCFRAAGRSSCSCWPDRTDKARIRARLARMGRHRLGHLLHAGVSAYRLGHPWISGGAVVRDHALSRDNLHAGLSPDHAFKSALLGSGCSAALGFYWRQCRASAACTPGLGSACERLRRNCAGSPAPA